MSTRHTPSAGGKAVSTPGTSSVSSKCGSKKERDSESETMIIPTLFLSYFPFYFNALVLLSGYNVLVGEECHDKLLSLEVYDSLRPTNAE